MQLMSNPISRFSFRIRQPSRGNAQGSKRAGATLLAQRAGIDTEDTLYELSRARKGKEKCQRREYYVLGK